MKTTSHKPGRRLVAVVAFAAAAVAAPGAFAWMPPEITGPQIDGGYVGTSHQVSTPIVAGEKAHGFQIAPTTTSVIRSEKLDGLQPTSGTTVVATSSESNFDWNVLGLGLALGAVLALLLGAAVVFSRNRVRVAHS
jgi:hypothetical protein